MTIEAYAVASSSQPGGKPMAAKSCDDIGAGNFQTEESIDLMTQLRVFRLGFEAVEKGR